MQVIDVESVAKLIASEHRKEDHEIQEIFWVPNPDEVYIIEVSNSVPDTGEVLPFRFAPDPPDIPCSSVMILIGPNDWQEIQMGNLSLPPAFAGSRVAI